MIPNFETTNSKPFEVKTTATSILFIDPCELDEKENIQNNGVIVELSPKDKKFVSIHYNQNTITAISMHFKYGYASEWKHIGDIAVNSGQLLIIGLEDVLHWVSENDNEHDNDYDKIADIVSLNYRAGEYVLKNNNSVVVSHSGYGDGIYKLYVGYNVNGLMISAVILHEKDV